MMTREGALVSGLLALAISASACSPAPQAAGGQPPPEYVQFRPAATKGVLWRPNPDLYPNPQVAVLSMHRTNNFLAHYTTQELPKRGFVSLGMNPRCDNNEAACAPWEDNALDIKQGIEYLRGLPGITRVILWGSSGGGPTMTFYQAVAETGASFCQPAHKLMPCSDELNNLPKADGVILWDPHLGNSVGSLRSLNPAVINDAEMINHNADPVFDSSLDPFDPAHGFDPNGSQYSEGFVQRFYLAQAARMNRLIDLASVRMKQIENGTYRYSDNDTFIVRESGGGDLSSWDPAIDLATNSTIRPQSLLKNDASIEKCCLVRSVRPIGGPPESDRSFENSVRFATVKSFLSVNAIRSTSARTQVDWCSSNNSTICNVEQVSVPILIFAMQGSSHIQDGEAMYDHMASEDKEFVIIEGATHPGSTCTACMPPGQEYDGRYDNARRNGFDYVAKWIGARF